MNTIHIPTEIAEAVETLSSIEQLLTAQRWERAAIVAAFVRLSTKGAHLNGEMMSPGQFAALGISGLKSATTVQLYVERWLETHEGVYPEAGAEVLLPEKDWEPTRTGTNGASSIDGAVKRLTEMAAALDSTELAAAISEAAPEAAMVVAHEVMKPKAAKPKATPVHDEVDENLMALAASLGTASGHVTAIKLLLDRLDGEPVPERERVRLRRLADQFGMLADLADGVRFTDLAEMFAAGDS